MTGIQGSNPVRFGSQSKDAEIMAGMLQVAQDNVSRDPFAKQVAPPPIGKPPAWVQEADAFVAQVGKAENKGDHAMAGMLRVALDNFLKDPDAKKVAPPPLGRQNS